MQFLQEIVKIMILCPPFGDKVVERGRRDKTTKTAATFPDSPAGTFGVVQ
jgi:hypothetical protein